MKCIIRVHNSPTCVMTHIIKYVSWVNKGGHIVIKSYSLII